MTSDPKTGGRILAAVLTFVVFLWVLTTAPNSIAGQSAAALQAFQKNMLPSQQQISESYANFTYTPFQRKELAFKLLIPNGWRDIPLTVPVDMLQQDTQRMIPVAEQRAPDGDKNEASIQVAYTRMDMEMSLYDLVDLYLKQNNVAVLMRRQGTYNRRQIDEVLMRTNKDALSYLSRLTFSRHGDRVFVVSGSARESEFSRHAPSFAAAAISFTVQQKASNPYAVPMATFTSTGTPGFKFSYPKDWEIKSLQDLPAGQNAVDMRLVVRGEKKDDVTTYGFIHVAGFSKSTGRTPDQILAYLKEGFQSNAVSYQQCTLKANLMPKLHRPLGKLEKWDVMAKDVPGEAAFLVLPLRSDYLSLGLFCMRPGNNLVSWLHVWRVFEIVANDLTGKKLALAEIKNLSLPSDSELKQLVAGDMNDFAGAAQKQDFHAFQARLSISAQMQITPEKMRGAFGGFAKQNEMSALPQMDPYLDKEIYVDPDGLLKITGHYPTQPKATTFKLTYVHEQAVWKLLGIHVAMKKVP
jgi:hypothetical protein